MRINASIHDHDDSCMFPAPKPEIKKTAVITTIINTSKITTIIAIILNSGRKTIWKP